MRTVLKRMVKAKSGLYNATGCHPQVSCRDCGKPLTRAPKEPINEPTKAFVEKIQLRFSAVHFSACNACSTGLKGPPPAPPPPEPPAPTLAMITADKMKTRWLKKI